METKMVDKASKVHYRLRVTSARVRTDKLGSPTLSIDGRDFESLEQARRRVQEWLGEICSDPCNRVSWVDWGACFLEIQYTHVADGRLIHYSVQLEILRSNDRISNANINE